MECHINGAARIMTAEQAARYKYIGRVLINQALKFMADIERLIAWHEAPKPRGITKNEKTEEYL